jgi:tetratricopeptide (TPR) repeat protein
MTRFPEMTESSSRTLADKLWRTRQDAGSKAPWGFLGQGEGHLLYYLARDYYQGKGVIVDAGSFVGRSAWFLATGLKENPHLGNQPQPRIDCFDNFIVNDDLTTKALKEVFGRTLALGESTRFLFDRATTPVAEWLNVCEGDFHTYPWEPKPIEILFVDIAKLPSLNRRVVELMFPQLIPGVSLVIHQDYHHPWLPHIHLTMEYLHEYFEIVEPKIDDSTVFLLTRPIPPEELQIAAGIRLTWEFPRKLELMERAIARMPSDCRRHVELAKALMIGHDQSPNAAEEMQAALDAIDEKYGPAEEDPHWPIYRTQMQEAVAQLNDGLQQGWRLAWAKKPAEALKMAERIQADSPNYLQGLILRSHCFRMMGRLEEAAAVLATAESLAPTTFSVWVEKAWLSLAKNESETAVAFARRSLAAAHGNPQSEAISLDVLALALSSNGQHTEAIKEGEEALIRMPGHPVLLLHHAQNLLRAQRVEEARTIARQILTLAPEHKAAQEILAGS